jgi:hypothetical protein
VRILTLIYPRIRAFYETTSVLNKQLRTADKGWYLSLVVGRDAKNYSPKNSRYYENLRMQNFGFQGVFQNDINNEKWT